MAMLATNVLTSGSLFNKNVVHISAGAGHTLCVTSDGAVHSWGLNDRGQLGLGNTVNSPIPTVVAGILNGVTITKVSAGLVLF